ncbi:uncharacterized protein ISCGN_002006 [Ixodes scapularis]
MDLILGPLARLFACLGDLSQGPVSRTCLRDLSPPPDLPPGPASGTCFRDLPPGPFFGIYLVDQELDGGPTSPWQSLQPPLLALHAEGVGIPIRTPPTVAPAGRSPALPGQAGDSPCSGPWRATMACGYAERPITAHSAKLRWEAGRLRTHVSPTATTLLLRPNSVTNARNALPPFRPGRVWAITTSVGRTLSSASRTRASYASTPAPVESTVEPPDMQLTHMALPSPNPQLPPEAVVPLGESTRDTTQTQSTPKDRDPSDTLLCDPAKDGSDTEAAEAAHEEAPSNTRDQDPTSTPMGATSIDQTEAGSVTVGAEAADEEVPPNTGDRDVASTPRSSTPNDLTDAGNVTETGDVGHCGDPAGTSVPWEPTDESCMLSGHTKRLRRLLREPASAAGWSSFTTLEAAIEAVTKAVKLPSATSGGREGEGAAVVGLSLDGGAARVLPPGTGGSCRCPCWGAGALRSAAKISGETWVALDSERGAGPLRTTSAKLPLDTKENRFFASEYDTFSFTLMTLTMTREARSKTPGSSLFGANSEPDAGTRGEGGQPPDSDDLRLAGLTQFGWQLATYGNLENCTTRVRVTPTLHFLYDGTIRKRELPPK